MIEVRTLHKKSSGHSHSSFDHTTITVPKGQLYLLIDPIGKGMRSILQGLGVSAVDAVPVPVRSVHTRHHELPALDVVGKLQRSISIVREHHPVCSCLTVLQNVMELPLLFHDLSSDAAYQEALRLLDRFNVRHLKNTYPSRLKPGEMRRAALARALSLQPEGVILENPLAGLERSEAATFLKMIRSVADEDCGVLILSLDDSLPVRVVDRAGFFRGGEIIDIPFTSTGGKLREKKRQVMPGTEIPAAATATQAAAHVAAW